MVVLNCGVFVYVQAEKSLLIKISEGSIKGFY